MSDKERNYKEAIQYVKDNIDILDEKDIRELEKKLVNMERNEELLSESTKIIYFYGDISDDNIKYFSMEFKNKNGSKKEINLGDDVYVVEIIDHRTVIIYGELNIIVRDILENKNIKEIRTPIEREDYYVSHKQNEMNYIWFINDKLLTYNTKNTSLQVNELIPLEGYRSKIWNIDSNMYSIVEIANYEININQFYLDKSSKDRIIFKFTKDGDRDLKETDIKLSLEDQVHIFFINNKFMCLLWKKTGPCIIYSINLEGKIEHQNKVPKSSDSERKYITNKNNLYILTSLGNNIIVFKIDCTNKNVVITSFTIRISKKLTFIYEFLSFSIVLIYQNSKIKIWKFEADIETDILMKSDYNGKDRFTILSYNEFLHKKNMEYETYFLLNFDLSVKRTYEIFLPSSNRNIKIIPKDPLYYVKNFGNIKIPIISNDIKNIILKLL